MPGGDGRDGAAAHSPLSQGPGRPGPRRPPGLPPRGRAWGRRRMQPRRAARPPARPEAPGGPQGRGRPVARGAGRGRRGARGLGRPSPSLPAALPRPGPRRPRRSPRSVRRRRNPRRSCPRGRPRGPPPPRSPHPGPPATPAPAPLTLSFSARGLAWAGESPASHQRGAGSGLGSSAGTAFPPAPGLQRESLPVEQEGVRIIFLFWKLKSAPGVGDREGEIPECTLQPRRQGCPPAREEAAASYSTTTGTART